MTLEDRSKIEILNLNIYGSFMLRDVKLGRNAL
jgi:hypothetical protein